jgi:hypothetical protein
MRHPNHDGGAASGHHAPEGFLGRRIEMRFKSTLPGAKRLRPLAAALLLILWAASSAGQEPFKVNLQFHFDKDKDMRPQPLAGMTPLALGPVSDARGFDDPAVIGESQVKRPTRPVVSGSPIQEFVGRAIEASFAAWKVNVSKDADRVLRCEILQFTVLEKGRVSADVRFRFKLEDRSGAALWQAEVQNDDGTWGRSLNEKNYIRAFSAATQRALVDLVDNPGFRKALTKPQS